MGEEEFDDRALGEWLEDHRTRIEALENRLNESQSLKDTLDTFKEEVSEKLRLADETAKRTADLRAALTELSDIVSQPKAPTGTTTGIEGGLVLSVSPAPPEAPPETPPEKEEPPAVPPRTEETPETLPEKEEEHPEKTPEEYRSEAIHRIAEFLKR